MEAGSKDALKNLLFDFFAVIMFLVQGRTILLSLDSQDRKNRALGISECISRISLRKNLTELSSGFLVERR